MRYASFVIVLALGCFALVLPMGCNKSIGDPSDAENQVTVANVDPNMACADIDGTVQQSGEGGGGTVVFYDAKNKLTFESRVRGNADMTDSVWSDVIFTSVDITYQMNDGGDAPAPWIGRPAPAITVKANSTTTVDMITVPVADIGPGRALAESGRLGVITMVFHGKDAANQPATASVKIPLGTYNACQSSGS